MTLNAETLLSIICRLEGQLVHAEMVAQAQTQRAEQAEARVAALEATSAAKAEKPQT